MILNEPYYVPVGPDGRIRADAAGTREEAQEYIDLYPALRKGLRVVRVRVVEEPEVRP